MDDGLNALWIKLFLFSKKGLPFSSAHADRAEHTSWSATKDLLDCISTARRQNQSSLWPELGLGDVLGCSHGGNDP